MIIYPTFPTCRAENPTRRAEKLIYAALESSDLDGQVLYEAKPVPHAPQIDFAVWIAGIGIFGIQVKGGKYLLVDGQWYLITDRGRFLRESPVPETWDAAMAIRDVVQEHLHQNIFVIPVLVMPDMDPDPAIEALAGSRNVAMHWGSPDGLVAHLEELATARKIIVKPTPASIAAQVQLVAPELPVPVRAPVAPDVQHLHINRVEHFHIHVGPEGLSDLKGAAD